MLYIIIILFIIAMALEYIMINKKSDINIQCTENINYSEKYVKKDYLLTQTELKFYRLLKQITDELNLVVCPQVALYQVVQNKNLKTLIKFKIKALIL